jgi:ATP-binding cassette subfamily B protein
VLFYLIISLLTKKLLKSESIRITEMNPKIHRYMQEGIGGIREIILDGTQEVFSEKFGFLDGIRRLANLKIHIISSTPNAFMQTFGIILIAFLASNTGESHQMNSSLPLMGALAFGFLRISPALQSIYSSWVSISSGRVTLDYILEFFNESPAYLGRANHPKPIEFSRKIKLKNIFFRYRENLPFVIKDLTLSINKGDRIGLAGMTGNGKSTLCDIIMGLLDATSGTLQVDDTIINLGNLRSWQAHIAHVPQSIFLSDSTIAENIAFGVPQEEIDYDKVVLAAQQAQISKTIEEWETGYNTLVGERGIRLSGGQRQRIGIARALYKEADVIIFDEATSALDTETELEVIKAIESLSIELTIIIIAHRTTTLKNCNKVYEMVDNNIVEKKSK